MPLSPQKNFTDLENGKKMGSKKSWVNPRWAPFVGLGPPRAATLVDLVDPRLGVADCHKE